VHRIASFFVFNICSETFLFNQTNIMKKQILLFSIALLFVTASIAQIDKGDILLGGTFGFGNTNQSSAITTTSSNANVHPKLGYAIGRNSVLNLAVGYDYGKTESETSNQTTKLNSFRAGISWQKFFPIKNNVGWYAELAAAYTKAKIKYQMGANSFYDVNSNGYAAAANPGIYFMPTSSLLLTGNVGGVTYGYSKDKNDGQPTAKNSNFSINLLSYFGFGIAFVINKKTD
jgi:hypothetical protein